MSTSLSEKVLEMMTSAGDAIAVESLGSTWTGTEAQREIEFWVSRFKSLGLVAGSTVGLSMPSGPAVAFSSVAGLHLGLRLAYFNPELGRSDLSLQMGLVQPHVHIIFDPGIAATEVRTVALAELRVSSSGLGHRAQPGGELIGFTSGTSGPPKAVRHLANRIHGRLMTFQSVFKIERGQQVVCVLPTYLLASLITSSLFGLWAGARVNIIPKFNLDGFAEVVSTQQCTYMMAVPAIYRAIIAQRADIAESLRDGAWLLCGAAPLDEKTQKDWTDAGGAPLSTCYGSTEAGGLISVDSTCGRGPLGSAGRPMPDLGLRITTSNGRDLGSGEQGEIRLARSRIFASYMGAQPPAADTREFVTGDLGHVDAEGFLFLGGRSSDVINRGGFKILPAEIEQCLLRMPLIEACAVVAAPDERLGEVPVAFVESRSSITHASVKEFMAGELTGYKIPVQVRCVPPGDLPRGTYGKWDRKELRRLAQDWSHWKLFSRSRRPQG